MLWPGGFVNVRLRLYVETSATVVPAAAVMTGQQGTYVFIVQPDSTAAMKLVTVEREAGDIAVISGEIKPGDRVVTDGQMLLRQGARVQIRTGASRRAKGTDMNISGVFIRRPVMTTLVMAAIMIFGLIAYRQLPVSDLPPVDYPTISVSASLAGASAETMASSVATPLEKQFSTIAGLETMTSISSQGNSSITLQFALSKDIDATAQDVQSAISRVLRQLPRDIVPPSFNKVDPSASPILFYALRTSTMPLSELDEYAQTTLAQRLSTIDGVAQVQVYGSQKYAIRIQLDPQALAVRNIGIDEVTRAIEGGNVNLPTGILWGTDKAYAVESEGQLVNAADFRTLVVAYRNGIPVRLQDLGRVIDSVQDTKVGQLVQRPALHRAGHPAAAGDQHRRRGGPGEGGHGTADSPASRLGRDRGALRPLGDDPRIGP